MEANFRKALFILIVYIFSSLAVRRVQKHRHTFLIVIYI